MKSSLRLGRVFSCISLLTALGWGAGTSSSSAIVRVDAHSGQNWLVQTYAGPVQATASAFRPPSAITIVLLQDTLAPADSEQIRKDLGNSYPEFHGRSVRIAFLRNNGELAGPIAIAGRESLRRLLSTATPATDGSAPGSTVLLDDLIAALPRIGSHSMLILVGNLPQLDNATTSFAAAMLSKTLGAQQCTASLISPGNSEPWGSVFRSHDGDVLKSIDDLRLNIQKPGDSLVQLDWTALPPAAGFAIWPATILDDSQTAVLVGAPDLSAAEGLNLPSIEQYAEGQKKVAAAEMSLAGGPLTQDRAELIRQDIQIALQTNSRDVRALRLATSLYEKAQNYPQAVAMAANMIEVAGRDGSAQAIFGHALLRNSELERAEAALTRAQELGTTSPELNEDFARLHIARKDDKGALPYLKAVLREKEKDQELWFLQAHTAERASETELAEQSYEHGLSLGGTHVAEVGSAMRLYLAAKQKDKALHLAQAQLAALPADAEDRLLFASMLDDLQQSSLALEAWKKLVEIQPTSDRGRTRVAQLLLERGNAAGAEEEAITGLASVPNSPSLHLVKAQAEEKLGRTYAARLTLEEGAQSPDLPLAIQLASTEEEFFGGAPAAYERVAELAPSSSPDYVRALERGFDTAMRDADFQEAEKLSAQLEAAGHHEYRALLGGRSSDTSLATVPGGLNALGFAAHLSREEIPPDRFFLEYSRALVNQGIIRGKNEYVEGIEGYFERLAALRALSSTSSGDFSITLSLTDKRARHATEKVLNVLGIRLRSSKGEVELAQGEKKSQAIKQETASALALDEVGIQEALQSGKSYQLVIHNESAAVFPSEQTWRDSSNLKTEGPGGFPEELIRVPHMASTYVGLNEMDRAAAQELLKAVSLRDLREHDADLLFTFAPALALEGNRAAVPGGKQAEPIWTSLVGVSPATPGAFFRALLKHDDGRLLVYFAMLAQLDRPHQSFFTANEVRTKRFYELLLTTPQMRTRPYGEYHDSGFQRMLRSVPLDEQGHVEFPGSPEVWMVAKGRSSSEEHTAHLMKKVHKAAAPDLEDTLLARLTETQYKDSHVQNSELDNFLAVAFIDAHRPVPMDEESALLLAQKYPDHSPLYPYLTDLRTLTTEDYRQFFSAFDRIAGHPALDANLQVGQLHALTGWICLLVQRHLIKDEQATALLRKLATGFSAAEDAASYTRASLEVAASIVEICNADVHASADAALASCLLGVHVAPDDERMKDFARVMDAQRVPSLQSLLELKGALARLRIAKSASAEADTIQKLVDGLPNADIPKEAKIAGPEKASLLRYDTGACRKIAAQIREKAAKHKVNPKDLQKLAGEMDAELEGPVTASLAGPLYGFFLRSSDAVVMKDPLLLRKHHYFFFDTRGENHEMIVASDFTLTTEPIGSYFTGGFADFSHSAGLAAAHSKDISGGIEGLAAQLATIRSAEWDRLAERDLRLVSLRVLVAREWTYESARNGDLLTRLSEQTMGLLSLSRRAELLNGISSREWRRVWDSITLPELYSLGKRYTTSFPESDPWSSEATKALRRAEQAHSEGALNVLGPIPTHIFGCNHPHLVSDAPYEEYEHHMPVEMGERVAEFQLFLAFQGDTLGLSPRALANADEKLAVKAFRKARMADYRDWRALLNAYASMTSSDVQQAVRNE